MRSIVEISDDASEPIQHTLENASRNRLQQSNNENFQNSPYGHQNRNQSSSGPQIIYNPNRSPWENWAIHTNLINSRIEFTQFIESRYNDIRRQSSKCKYWFKIYFQAFIYILNIVEVFFTLIYGGLNNLSTPYINLYLFSIIMTVLMNCFIFIYVYRYLKVKKQNIFYEILWYFVYFLLGGLSYFKLSPFLLFYTRDQKIQQFSFSQINKYLLLNDQNRYENPTGLYKIRTNPVNILRDLIFHRAFVLSLIVELILQIIPQIFIQGFHNSIRGEWNSFNIFNYLFLLSMLVYSLTEVQFIIQTTTYKYITTQIHFKLTSLRIKRIQETKQCLKANMSELQHINSFFFHISLDNCSDYDRKRCMVQIIKFLLQFKTINQVQFTHIDSYNQIELQYLNNALKILKPNRISLYIDHIQNQILINNIFQQYNNLTISHLQSNSNLGLPSIVQPKIDLGFIRNNEQKIRYTNENKFLYIILNDWNHNYQSDQQQYISNEFEQYQNDEQEQLNQNILTQNAQVTINQIPRQQIILEFLGILGRFYQYFEDFQTIFNNIPIKTIYYIIIVILNPIGSVFQIVYLIKTENIYQITLMILQILNTLMQFISFSIFYFKINTHQSHLKKIIICFIFLLFNIIKVWELTMIIIYYLQPDLLFQITRNFTYNQYSKFLKYSSKLKGSISITVFHYPDQNIQDQQQNINLNECLNQPFFQTIVWSTNVQETFNSIPQFFIYALATDQTSVDFLWVLSFLQALKEGIICIKDLLVTIVKDNFVSSLILRKISVQQFYQSMSFFSSIDYQIYIEQPKSFQILSKVRNQFFNTDFNFKINLTHMQYKEYKDQKKQKMLAQMRLVICQMRNRLEIEEAQQFMYLNGEIQDFFLSLKYSQIQHLKLDFNLECVKDNDLHHLLKIFENCPQNLNILHIQVESQNSRQVTIPLYKFQNLRGLGLTYSQTILKQTNQNQIDVERQTIQDFNSIFNLKFQQIQQQSQNQGTYAQNNINNFKQLYFQFQCYLDMDNLKRYFQQFTRYEEITIDLENYSNTLQQFNFISVFSSTNITKIKLILNRFDVIFLNFGLQNLNYFKIELIDCNYNPAHLGILLNTVRRGEVYVDFSKSRGNNNNQIRQDQVSSLIASLEQRGIYAQIVI